MVQKARVRFPLSALTISLVVWSRGKIGACKAFDGGSNPPTAFLLILNTVIVCKKPLLLDSLKQSKTASMEKSLVPKVLRNTDCACYT